MQLRCHYHIERAQQWRGQKNRICRPEQCARIADAVSCPSCAHASLKNETRASTSLQFDAQSTARASWSVRFDTSFISLMVKLVDENGPAAVFNKSRSQTYPAHLITLCVQFFSPGRIYVKLMQPSPSLRSHATRGRGASMQVAASGCTRAFVDVR